MTRGQSAIVALAVVLAGAGCRQEAERSEPSAPQPAPTPTAAEPPSSPQPPEQLKIPVERSLPPQPGGEARGAVGEPATAPVEKVRPAALAGSWYEDDPGALRRSVEEFLDRAAETRVDGYPIALIVPHAGHRFSGQTAAHAYTLLEGRSYARVFLLGPAHTVAFEGIGLPGVSHFETPLGMVPVATEAVAALLEHAPFVSHPGSHAREHSLEIQLPFLQVALDRFELVPMVVSRLSEEEIAVAAKALSEVVGPGDLLIASSDFTHYGPRFGYLGPPDGQIGPSDAEPKLKELLDRAWEPIARKDTAGFLSYQRKSGDTICGFVPIAIVLSALPADARSHLLATETSGRLTGDFTDSVSYLSAAFTGLWPYHRVAGVEGLANEERTGLLRLARTTVDVWVKEQRRVTPEELGIEVTERMRTPSGAFVTLKQLDGDLRGCIGTVGPASPLVETVSDNAVNAAWHDRRFQRVTPGELAGLRVEVSVLTPPLPAAGWQEIILGRHGIILEKNGRSALFLPQVAPEQGWTVDETLSHLSRKAGLPADGWRTGASFSLFQAQVFGEGE